MTDAIRNVFETKKKQVGLPPTSTQAEHYSLVQQGVPAFVTFITAGFPTRDATVPILLAMQEGGADIIELGMPFSDPIADGPTIQEANTVRDYTNMWCIHSVAFSHPIRVHRSLSKMILIILHVSTWSRKPARRD